MPTHTEESPSDVSQFALSAIHMVITLLHERKNAAGCRIHASIVRQSVFLHLLNTFDRKLGLAENRKGMNFRTMDTDKNISWPNELLEEGKYAEKCLAHDIFTGDGFAAYPCFMDVLIWFITEVLLPFAHSWEEFNIWKCATGNNNNNNNNDSGEEKENSHPFIQWSVSILNAPDSLSGTEWQLSPLKQCVVSLSVLLRADTLILSKYPNLFTDAYIRSLVVACTAGASPKLFVELTQSICRGVIRGDALYYNDLRILLETLRRFVDSCDAACDAQKVQTAIDVLLNTSCPLGGEADVARGVASVCEWFKLLHLDSNYREVLVRGGIDGEVLRSGLTVHDVQEMGICSAKDAAVLLRVLSTHPQQSDGGIRGGCGGEPD